MRTSRYHVLNELPNREMICRQRDQEGPRGSHRGVLAPEVQGPRLHTGTRVNGFCTRISLATFWTLVQNGSGQESRDRSALRQIRALPALFPPVLALTPRNVGIGRLTLVLRFIESSIKLMPSDPKSLGWRPLCCSRT